MVDYTRIFQRGGTKLDKDRDMLRFNAAEVYAQSRVIPEGTMAPEKHKGGTHKRRNSQQSNGYIVISTAWVMRGGSRKITNVYATNVKLAVRIQPQYASAVCSLVKKFSGATVISEEWQDDRCWVAVIDLKPDIKDDFLDQITSQSRGNIETRELPANWSLYGE